MVGENTATLELRPGSGDDRRQAQILAKVPGSQV